MREKFLKGFTFIEIMLTVVLLTAGIAGAVSWNLSTLKRSELNSTAETIVGILRKTQAAAQNGVSGVAGHGVKLEAEHLYFYEGESLAVSIPSTRTDLVIASPLRIQNILLSGGGNEAVFRFSSGETSQYGSFQIVNTETGELVSITISQFGLIDWL